MGVPKVGATVVVVVDVVDVVEVVDVGATLDAVDVVAALVVGESSAADSSDVELPEHAARIRAAITTRTRGVRIEDMQIVVT